MLLVVNSWKKSQGSRDGSFDSLTERPKHLRLEHHITESLLLKDGINYVERIFETLITPQFSGEC